MGVTVAVGNPDSNRDGGNAAAPPPRYEQAILNYFVRYRIKKDDPSLHRWSRIERVVLLSDVQRERELRQQHASASSSSSPRRDSIVWKEKRFFVALKIVGEEEVVLLPRLSAHPPTEQEVLAFCSREARDRPENIFRTHVAPSAFTTDYNDNNNNNGELVAYLPTSEQVAKMAIHRRNVLERHTMTEEELAEVRRRMAPYAREAAATAPLQCTIMQQRSKQQQPGGVLVGLPTIALSSGDDWQANSVDTTPFSSQATTLQFSASQPGGGGGLVSPAASQSARPLPPSSPLPSSPFLPKKMYHRKRFPNSATPLHASEIAASSPIVGGGGGLVGSPFSTSSPQLPTSATAVHFPGPRRQSSLLEGSGMVLSEETTASQLQLMQTMQAQTAASPVVLGSPLLGGSGLGVTSMVSKEDEENYRNIIETVERFKEYVNEPQRSAYISTVVSLSERNRLENKRRKLLGHQNERRQERNVNMMESTGLWITDDGERKRRAQRYAEREKGEKGEAAAAPAKAQSTTAQTGVTATAVAQVEAAEAPKRTKSEEEKRLERFIKHHEEESAKRLQHAPADLFKRLATPPSPAPSAVPPPSPARQGHTLLLSVAPSAAGSDAKLGSVAAHSHRSAAAGADRGGLHNTVSDTNASVTGGSKSVSPEWVRAQLIHRSGLECVARCEGGGPKKRARHE